jgi:hypothetical protein
MFQEYIQAIGLGEQVKPNKSSVIIVARWRLKPGTFWLQICTLPQAACLYLLQNTLNNC